MRQLWANAVAMMVRRFRIGRPWAADLRGRGGGSVELRELCFESLPAIRNLVAKKMTAHLKFVKFSLSFEQL